MAHLKPEANIAVPLPGEELVQLLWNTPELLRVDAELLLWHAVPDAARAAEAKLLRAWRSLKSRRQSRGNSASPSASLGCGGVTDEARRRVP